MLESMRFSVAPDNIKVAVSNPGPVTSNWFERMEKSEGDTKEKELTLQEKMTIVERNMLSNYRDNFCQSAESCAASIVDVIEREYTKKIDDGNPDVCFWNGTSDHAQETVAGVKADPTGHTGPAYQGMWKMAYGLAQAAKAGKDHL